MTKKTATGATELRDRLSRIPAWVMAVSIALVVIPVSVGMPFLVRWLWPGLAEVVLVVGNMFFAMILGIAGVVGFLLWRSETSR